MGLLSVPEAAGSDAKGWGEPDGADGEEAVRNTELSTWGWRRVQGDRWSL